MEVFIIILRLKMICFPTILKSSRIINPDLLDIPKSADEVKSAIVYVYLNYVHYCQELGVEFMANYYTPKTSLWTHWSVPNVRTRSWLYTIICRNVSVPGIISPNPGYWGYHDRYSYDRYWKCFRMVPERGERRFWGKYETFPGILYEWSLLTTDVVRKIQMFQKHFFRAASFFIIMESTVRMNLLNTNILLRTNIFIGNKHFVAVNFICRHKKEPLSERSLKVLSILEGKWHFLMPTIISLCLYYSPGCKKKSKLLIII